MEPSNVPSSAQEERKAAPPVRRSEPQCNSTSVRGRRFHRIQHINSHRSRNRWRFLSAQVGNEFLPTCTPDQKQPQRQQQTHSESSTGRRIADATSNQKGYDIDGDGGVDVRELKLAKYLDNMLARRRQEGKEELSAAATEALRQRAGRYMLAIEFVERNRGALGRYGEVFASLDASQSVEYIATHKNFKMLMLHLEAFERKKGMRSSQNMRNCLVFPSQLDGDTMDSGLNARGRAVAWHDASQHVYGKAFMRSNFTSIKSQADTKPLDLQDFILKPEDPKSSRRSVKEDSLRQIVANAYGAVDINGDGIIDFDEMKLNLQVQELTLERESMIRGTEEQVACEQPFQPQGSPSNSPKDKDTVAKARQEHLRRQQMEGRRLMAKEFVQRNNGYMGIYNASFQGKSEQEMIEMIATNECFGGEYNRLRAKERVMTLKSSKGVASCLVQPSARQFPTDSPSQPLAVQSARKRIFHHRTTPEAPGVSKPVQLPPQKLNVVIPKLFTTPVRLQPVDSFAISNWNSSRGHHAGI